jgi:hypothetical protein
MKKIILTILCALSICHMTHATYFLVHSNNQYNEIDFTRLTKENEKDVATAVTKLVNLLRNPDQVGLQSLIHPQLSYGHSSGRIEGKAGFIENLMNGNSDFVEIEIKDQSIIVVGSTAIVRHLLEASIIDSAVPANIKLHVITTWVKGKKGWQLLARQAIKAT